MNNWVAEELKSADLGDKRLNKRLTFIVEGLASKPDKTVPQTFEDASQAQAVYEFWSNPHVKPSQIIAAHTQSTVERIKGHSIVLAIQDTTDLEFASLATRRGLGEISKQGAEGIKVHNVLAVTTEGILLGLIKQIAWIRKKTRKGKGYEERKRKIEEKESYTQSRYSKGFTHLLVILYGGKFSCNLIPKSCPGIIFGDQAAEVLIYPLTLA